MRQLTPEEREALFADMRSFFEQDSADEAIIDDETIDDESLNRSDDWKKSDSLIQDASSKLFVAMHRILLKDIINSTDVLRMQEIFSIVNLLVLFLKRRKLWWIWRV